jgi:transcriptional regulator with XRE-family HTH domain
MPRRTQNTVDRHVGGRLRSRRLMLGMSQTDVAKALGLTFQQVQKYEKGTNRIGSSRLQHLSQILQVTVPYFFEGQPSTSAVLVRQAKSPSYIDDFIASADGLALAKAFMHIDGKLRRAIVALVAQIAPEIDETAGAEVQIEAAHSNEDYPDKGSSR